MSSPPRLAPEPVLEALELGLFMISAASFAVLLEHPESPVHAVIPSALARRALMGVAMGTTAFLLVRSPMGRRSGAHMNPATTLAFASLGRVGPGLAARYVVAQLLGAVAGLALAWLALGRRLPEVDFVATRPGPSGARVAFVAEAALAFVLMAVVLRVLASRRPELAPAAVAALVALYITVEAPLSGMSLNPARSFASALLSRDLGSLWVYLAAPPLGMLAAAWTLAPAGGCARLLHDPRWRCVFCGEPPAAAPSPLAARSDAT